MWPNLQVPTDLVTFTEEILNGKLHFWCSDASSIIQTKVNNDKTKTTIERFVAIVNGSRPWTIITKRSILNVAAVLDTPLQMLLKSYLA